MSSLRNISVDDLPYKMTYSLSIFHIVCSSTILVTGIFVNLGSICVIFRLKLFRETSVIFILHLIVVNLTASIVVMSIALLNTVFWTGKKDIQCRVTGYIVFVFIGVKMCSITLISVSTYLNVAHAVSVKTFFSKTHNVVLCLISTWTLPCFNMSLPLTEVWGEFIVVKHMPWCFPLAGGYGTYLVCFSLVITMSALLLSYIEIVRTVLQSRRKVKDIGHPGVVKRKKNDNERHLIVAVIIMVTSNSIFFLPTSILPIADPNFSLGIYAHAILTYFLWTSNIVETLIYSILHNKIRKGIKSFVTCKW